MTREEIAGILKEYRERAGLTQKEAAERIGRKQQTLASWETGQSQPDANTLFVLFDSYGASVDTAFGFKKSSNSTMLVIEEYPTMARYRALSSRGKEVVDRLLDKLYAEEKENAPTAYSDERIETILQNRPDLTELANQIRMMDGEQTLKAIDYIQYLLSQQDKT